MLVKYIINGFLLNLTPPGRLNSLKLKSSLTSDIEAICESVFNNYTISISGNKATPFSFLGLL